jgi:dihydroflavonol-4-reductase
VTVPVRTVITGATGVVGGAILRHLLADGIPVRALMRTRKDLPGVVEVAHGDILDPDSLVSAFAGADLVYHVAGVNQMCASDPSQMYRSNVDGSANVLRAARAAGVARIVYTSSAATIGEAEGDVGNEETLHRGDFHSQYERSKYEAELVMMEHGADLDVVVVNPSSVQGPGRSTGTGRLLLDLIAGRLSTLIDTRVSIVDIDDCARGHLLAAAKGANGRRYLLNSFSMTIQEAVLLVEAVTGQYRQIRYVPAWLASVAGAVIGAGYRIAGREAPLCSETVRTLLHGHVYDGSRATRELGLVYTPAHQTLARLIEWAHSQALIP